MATSLRQVMVDTPAREVLMMVTVLTMLTMLEQSSTAQKRWIGEV